MGAAGRARDDDDLVADDETGEQANAEAADEIDGAVPEVGALGGLADGGEEAVDFLLGQADAVVAEGEGRRLAARGVDLDSDLAAVVRLQVGAGAQGVHAVLQQLAHEHLRAAVEVVRENVDQATQVDLKFVIHWPAPSEDGWGVGCIMGTRR